MRTTEFDERPELTADMQARGRGWRSEGVGGAAIGLSVYSRKKQKRQIVHRVFLKSKEI